MKPICAKCQVFFRPKLNGVSFLEGMPNNNRSEWSPYKLWIGDLWECPTCQAEIIHGVGGRPISEHYEENFKDLVKKCEPILQVNDC